MYGTDLRVTAFTESLAYKSPSASEYGALAEEARLLVVPLHELLTELRSAGIPIDGMGPGWRLDRKIHRLSFPALPGFCS